MPLLGPRQHQVNNSTFAGQKFYRLINNEFRIELSLVNLQNRRKFFIACPKVELFSKNPGISFKYLVKLGAFLQPAFCLVFEQYNPKAMKKLYPISNNSCGTYDGREIRFIEQNGKFFLFSFR